MHWFVLGLWNCLPHLINSFIYLQGFSDTRHETVKVLRPMKDITKEELSNYAAIKLITCPLPQEENKSNMDSLQSLINSFVVDLQENYSATISTVCKTAEKIGSAVNECDKRCFHCQVNNVYFEYYTNHVSIHETLKLY